jgi:amino acid adenylation domain-containing protein
LYQNGIEGMKRSLVPPIDNSFKSVTIEKRVDIPLLPGSERQPLMAWNTTQQDFPQELCMPQLVERQAQAKPDAPALFMDGQSLSYRQLNEQANQLAHYLRACGVGPNVLVSSCFERSLDMVVALLGISKAGGAYVALDPSYPSERLSLMMKDARVPVLVTKQQTAERFMLQETRMICLDADVEMLASMSRSDPEPVVTAADLAYVVYTSGSTGQPKGVQITHRSLLNLMFWHQRTFEVQASDRATQFASPAFDVTGEELWPHLMCGVCVYLIDEDIRFDPVGMQDWLVRHAITLAILPTALVESLIALEWPSSCALRVVLTGGDTLYRYPPATLPFALINNYGPSETTVVATAGRVFPDEDATMLPSIGRPIANAQIYILDEQLQPVPVGVLGELHIGGAGLARGYLDRPELTAEKFIPNPFIDEPGARLYKTGDLARYLPDGQIMFMGRTDFQIKIRGYRIEPNEIMHALNRHPAIAASIVVAREDSPGNKRLVAYITLVPGGDVTVSSLRNALLQHLPEYMVPSTFVILDEFPVNANGKVSGSVLPMPTATNTLRNEEITAPRTPTEERLVEIVAAILEVDEVGIDDNFFHLGGHSLLAARLIARIEQVFGKKISLSTMFAGPTVEQLARALQQQEAIQSRAPLLAVQASGSRRPFFFLHGDWTGGAFYCFDLSRALGSELPFYVLEPYKFGGLQVLPTIEEIAAAHLESLRAVQPVGPYRLGGFCNGGLVAYEMARQLYAAGQEVEQLLLISPTTPIHARLPISVRVMRKVIGGLTRFLRTGADKQADWFLRTRHALRHVYRFLRPSNSRLLDFAQLVELDQRLNNMFPPVEALYKDYVGVLTWLASGYMPDIYPGKITFLWARDELFIKDEWREIVEAKDKDTIENYFVPGTHMSCVTEHIQDVAERLRLCLSEM